LLNDSINPAGLAISKNALKDAVLNIGKVGASTMPELFSGICKHLIAPANDCPDPIPPTKAVNLF
jgi:hypothetical protein